MTESWQGLADENAIRRITAFYSDAVTHLDARRGASIFVEDGGVTILGRTITGRAAIEAGMRASFAEFDLLQLIAHGGQIAVAGDSAEARWSTVELTIRRNSQDLNLVFGRYEDRLVRRPEGWLFAARQFTMAGRARFDVAKLQLNPLFLSTLDPESPLAAMAADLGGGTRKMT